MTPPVSSPAIKIVKSVREQVSPEEWQTRVDLAAYSRAIEAGATAFEPPHDAFWGQRTAQFLDPSGHRWAVDRRLRDVPADELAEHVAAMFA